MVRDESGQSLVFFALFLVVLLGFTGLVVDVGVLLTEKDRLQNAADAAALAGVQELGTSQSRAGAMAREYAVKNGAPQEGITIDFPTQSRIRVQVSEAAPFFFARIFGVKEVTLSARATAEGGPVRRYRGVLPLGVERRPFVYGHPYILKASSQTPEEAPYHGNFGALALGGTGANRYRDNIEHGYDAWLAVGDTVTTEPGNMAGPTAQGLRYRLEQGEAAGCTSFAELRDDCPQLVVVPVVEGLYSAHGRDTVTVVGFAAFYLEDVDCENQSEAEGEEADPCDRKGAQAVVVGRFVRRVVDLDFNVGLGTETDFGLESYALVE